MANVFDAAKYILEQRGRLSTTAPTIRNLRMVQIVAPYLNLRNSSHDGFTTSLAA